MSKKKKPEVIKKYLDIDSLIYALVEGKLNVDFPPAFTMKHNLPSKTTPENFERIFSEFVYFLDARVEPETLARKYKMTPAEIVACREKWATAISKYTF